MIEGLLRDYPWLAELVRMVHPLQAHPYLTAMACVGLVVIGYRLYRHFHPPEPSFTRLNFRGD